LKSTNIRNFKERTPEQIAWASKIILQKICEIIKENQENGKTSIADGYIASLLIKGMKDENNH